MSGSTSPFGSIVNVTSRCSPLAWATPNALLLLVAVIYGQELLTGFGLQEFSILVLCITIFVGFSITRMFPERVWSLPFLLFLVISLFHVGLYVGPAFTGRSSVKPNGIWTSWINEENMRTVAWPLMLAFLSFAVFAGLGSWLSGSKKAKNETTRFQNVPTVHAIERCTVADTGSLLVFSGVSLWFGVGAATAGPMFVTGTYEHFLSATKVFPMGLLYLVIAIGAVFLAQDPFRPFGKVALIAFALFVLAGFVIGLRGETLIPFVSALAVYAKRNRMPSGKIFVVASIILLFAIAAVAQVRTVGLRGMEGTNVSAGPLEGIEEMGYSVRPLVASIEWHVDAGEDFELGTTYWAPFERGLSSLLLVPTIPAEDDYRLMNVEIAQRIGQIGGSIVAEAHHNFGNAGIVVVMGLTGLTGGLIARGRVTPVRVAMLGIFAVLILMHVRNSFAPLPLWGVFGLFLLAVSIVWARAKQLLEARMLVP